jgi:hypothetical protein
LNFSETITLKFPAAGAAHPPPTGGPVEQFVMAALKYAVAGFLTVVIVYCSLITTSAPVSYEEMNPVKRAITVLEAKGFTHEAFLLRHVVVYRSSDNWLNGIATRESAYAATNFPFEIITLYPDFYSKATDDTERAMVLLHEAQHIEGADEQSAYGYVWQNRQQLGWTRLKYGTTESYITIEELTRENAPSLFTCANKVWQDCTENLFVKK